MYLLIFSLFLLFTDLGRLMLFKFGLFIMDLFVDNIYFIFVLFLIYFRSKLS